MTEEPQLIIHLFRHAEAAHNTEDDTSIRDPLLTTNGIAQAEQIPTTYKFLNHPTLVLVSPLQRAIQTALHAFHPKFNLKSTELYAQGPGVPRFVALPQLQEVSENPCDTGVSLRSLRKEHGEYIEFPGELFESDEWFRKQDTPFANESILLSKRAKFVRDYLEQSRHKEVVVVTHGDFSHFLVNRWLYGPGCGSLFDGLKHAAGLPMTLKAKDLEGDLDSEMAVEIPAWFIPQKHGK